jgi:hypothetical protein
VFVKRPAIAVIAVLGAASGMFWLIGFYADLNGRFSFIDRDMITERVSILNTGNVGIGTNNPTERLQVVGNIKVSGSILNSFMEEDVPDYIFEPNYRLMSIKELESYLAAEKHLPNVLSATEIKQNDLNMSEFQMKLQEKIEELTLYIVGQAKEIDNKNAEMDTLKARISALEQLSKQK